MTEPDAAFQAYLAPARTRAALWRLGAGLVLVTAVYLGLNAGALGLLAALRGPDAAGNLAASLGVASTPQSALILLASFVPLVLGVVLAVRLLHRRPVASLLGPRARLLPDFLRGAAVVLAVQAPLILLWLAFADSAPNLPTELWLALLPLTALGIAVQTLAEELLFRGYLVQQLAVRFGSALIWAGLPALAFAGLHFDPARLGGIAPLAVAVALLFALVATDLTRRTGGLGAAWGAHFANNFVGIAIVSTTPALGGLALRSATPAPEQITLSPLLVALELLPMLIVWALLRRWLAR